MCAVATRAASSAAGVVSAVVVLPAAAGDYWWVGDVNGIWGDVTQGAGGAVTNTNWGSALGGGSDPLAVPGSGDLARLTATNSTRFDITISGSVAVAGITTEPTLASDVGVSGGELAIGAAGIDLQAPVILTIGSNVNVSSGALVIRTAEANSAMIIGGAIRGGASLVKTGSGAVLLAGSNSYTGGTVIRENGLVLLGSDGAVPAGGVLSVEEGGLDLNGFSATVGDLNFGSDAAVGDRLVRNGMATGALTLNGNINYFGSSNSDGTPTGAAAHIDSALVLGPGVHAISNPNNKIANSFYDVSITGVVSGVGGLRKTGAIMTMALTAANTYTGATVIEGGMLFAGATNAIPAGSAVVISGGALRMNPTQAVNGVVPGSYSQKVASLSGTGGRVDMGSATLTVGDGSSTVFGGVITGPGGSLIKTGSGTLSLTRANTYSGDTTVRAGRLVVSNNYTVGRTLAVDVGGIYEMAATGRWVARFTSVSVAEGGVLALNSSDLIVDYAGASPLAGLIAAYGQGRITSATVFGGLPAYLAFSEAADLGINFYGGVALDETAVVGKFSYVGDSNLDGQVDALDYERVDLAIGNTGVAGTARGDLNYDGNVDALDYEQIDLNIGNGVGVPLGLGAAVMVPEPGVMGAAVFLAVAGRRRRPSVVCGVAKKGWCK